MLKISFKGERGKFLEGSLEKTIPPRHAIYVVDSSSNEVLLSAWDKETVSLKLSNGNGPINILSLDEREYFMNQGTRLRITYPVTDRSFLTATAI